MFIISVALSGWLVGRNQKEIRNSRTFWSEIEKFTAIFYGGISQLWSRALGSFFLLFFFPIKDLVKPSRARARARFSITSEATNGSWPSASHLTFPLSSDQVSNSLHLQTFLTSFPCFFSFCNLHTQAIVLFVGLEFKSRFSTLFSLMIFPISVLYLFFLTWTNLEE